MKNFCIFAVIYKLKTERKYLQTMYQEYMKYYKNSQKDEKDSIRK